jgi:hypothetical protein
LANYYDTIIARIFGSKTQNKIFSAYF